MGAGAGGCLCSCLAAGAICWCRMAGLMGWCCGLDCWGLKRYADGPAGDAYGEWVFRAAAGEDWDRFVQRTVKDTIARESSASAGIPGTVGGTPVQNVGAYGQEVASVIERVRVFDLVERGIQWNFGGRVWVCVSTESI